MTSAFAAAAVGATAGPAAGRRDPSRAPGLGGGGKNRRAFRSSSTPRATFPSGIWGCGWEFSGLDIWEVG